MNIFGDVGVWLTATFTLIGVVVGALLSPWATSHYAWRTARRQAFDRAIAAVRAADMARNYPRHANPTELGPDTDAAVQFNAQLAIRGFDRFFEATYEMRQALAALEPYFVPDWDSDQWQITEATATSLLRQLKNER